jgi:acyl-CoA reductase-like NAD-dependent aldehyde dehydrogenase
MTMVPPSAEDSLYIGGTWRQATDEPIDVIDPADERVLASVSCAAAGEVHAALTAARAAQRDWARTPSIVRGQYLRAMAGVLRSNKDRLADLIVSEVGKPVRQALDEVDFAIGFLSYSAEWDRRLEGETLPGEVPGEVIQLTHAPVGVVAAIRPWNFPLAVLAVEVAVAEGAEVVVGGSPPADEALRLGYWYSPTVLRGVRPEMTVMREETFGPVTPVVRVSSLREAVDLANDSRYGLSAYVFSQDYGSVLRSVDELEFGEIYINRTLGESIHAHHAGYRESGTGGEDGKWGLLRYTQVKTAYHHYG